jgi:hypothetical protein
MTDKIYVITVRWNNNFPNVEGIQEALSPLGNWLRFSDSVWFLITGFDASAIARRINRNRLGIQQIAILEVDPANSGGWSERWIWDWIRGR